MEANTVEIMNKGMKCLLDNLGIVETEYFISTVIREKFDYTKWQQEFFDKIPPNELKEKIADFAKNYKFEENPEVILK